jgi:hypothetical protein
VDGYSNGMLVRHATLGVGKVVAIERTALHVFFADAARPDAAKLRLPNAKAFLETKSVGRDERLENLPAFSLDPVTGRYTPDKPRVTARKARKAAAK